MYGSDLDLEDNVEETRVIIKILTHILAPQETLTDLHGDEAKNLSFFEKKKIKAEFFKTANFQKIFTKK